MCVSVYAFSRTVLRLTICGVLQGAEAPLTVAGDLGREDIADLLIHYGADLNKHDVVRFYNNNIITILLLSTHMLCDNTGIQVDLYP